MDIASRLLNRLERVKQTAANRWIARCPAHKDRQPSLSVAVSVDGLLLVHCHAGCEIEDVCAAVGLTVAELFPDRLVAHYRPGKTDCDLSPAEALTLIRHEVQVVAVLAAQMEEDPFAPVDLNRLHDAVGRINETVQRVRGA